MPLFSNADSIDLSLKGDIGEANIVRLIKSLSGEDYETLVNLLEFPSSYSDLERRTDSTEIVKTLKLAQRRLGNVTGATRMVNIPSYYEFGVATGNRPFWWQDAHTITKSFLFDVQSSSNIKYMLKVMTASSEDEIRIVGLFFCFPHKYQGSKVIATELIADMLDSKGVPKDHPFRLQMLENLPIVEGTKVDA